MRLTQAPARSPRALGLAALAAALLVIPACPDPGPPAGPPCEDDLTECDDDTSKFVEDPSCELSGDLELQFGEGEDSFSPLGEGSMPQLEFGFQGGQHAWLGVRVENADLERPQLKIRVSMKMCEVDCENPASWQTDNVRELVVDGDQLAVTDEGYYEVTSLLVQVFNWSGFSQQGVDMLVTDPCGRQGLIMARSDSP